MSLENQPNQNPQIRTNRRRFLLASLGVVSALALNGCVEPPTIKPSDKSNSPSFGQRLAPGSSADLSGLFTENKSNTPEILASSRQFMKLLVPVKGTVNQRVLLENQLFQSIEDKQASAADVLLALQAAGTVDARAWGMQMLWEKRQQSALSKFGILPLDVARTNWAVDNQIDPRMLAIARDAQGCAAELLSAAPELFFEATPSERRKNIRIENTIPNPGVVSKLNMTETGHSNLAQRDPVNQYWGYVFIGEGSAMDAINEDPAWFPNGKSHLRQIAGNLQKQTGLPYYEYVEMIPGSQPGVGDGSGGAIGPQFMPINWLLISEWYNEANKRLGGKYPEPNPFDPITGTVMCDLYLAAEFYARVGSVNNKLSIVRPGYYSLNDDDAKVQALMKWNPSFQARLSVDVGYDYFDNFGRN